MRRDDNAFTWNNIFFARREYDRAKNFEISPCAAAGRACRGLVEMTESGMGEIKETGTLGFEISPCAAAGGARRGLVETTCFFMSS